MRHIPADNPPSLADFYNKLSISTLTPLRLLTGFRFRFLQAARFGTLPEDCQFKLLYFHLSASGARAGNLCHCHLGHPLGDDHQHRAWLLRLTGLSKLCPRPPRFVTGIDINARCLWSGPIYLVVTVLSGLHQQAEAYLSVMTDHRSDRTEQATL